MRIIILGDSLPLHRPEEDIHLEDTYGHILKKELAPDHHVFIISKRANDSSLQSKPENLLYDMKQFEPGIVILQLGIVDSAPRLFSRPVQQIISNLPHSLRDFIIGFFSKRRRFFTKKFPKVYVDILEFENNMKRILGEIKEIGAEPIIVSIAKPPVNVASKSHNFIENVKSYNRILSKLAKEGQHFYVDFYGMVDENPELMCFDGIHISIPGNKALANELSEVIRKIIVEKPPA